MNEGNYDGIIIKYSSIGEAEWATSVGESSTDKIYSVVQTRDDDYIVGGSFISRSIQVGEYTLTNAEVGYEGMIIKFGYKELNNPITTSAVAIGESDSEIIESIFSTEDGGYIVGGSFTSSSIQVGEYTLINNGREGSSDGMIIKYSSNGEVEWATSVGGDNSDNIMSVALAIDGGYIVGGSFTSSSIQVGDYELMNVGDSDGMLIKYSSDGEVEWATSVGGDNSDNIMSVALAVDGGYIVGGDFESSSIRVGDYILRNKNGSSEGMIIKYSSDGEVEWATSVGGDNSDNIMSVALTTDGGYIAAGSFTSNSIQVGEHTLTNNGREDSSDGMIIKYSSDGEVEWATSVGGWYGDSIETVASTADGGYIVGGDFESSTIHLGMYTLTNRRSSFSDGMLIKYNSIGEVEWATSIGGKEIDSINSVELTSDGGYIVGGSFESSSIHLGKYTLTNRKSGNSDGMLIKYSSDGEIEWAKGIGGTSNEYIQSVVQLKDGTFIAGGGFNSPTIETDGKILTNNGSTDGMLLKVVNYAGVPEVQELIVENTRKQFKITTDINEIEWRKTRKYFRRRFKSL